MAATVTVTVSPGAAPETVTSPLPSIEADAPPVVSVTSQSKGSSAAKFSNCTVNPVAVRVSSSAKTGSWAGAIGVTGVEAEDGSDVPPSLSAVAVKV